tara:strand:- start:3936 stop:4238 length:303 start_codon:yes stop_codon:yes gene_type:complete
VNYLIFDLSDSTDGIHTLEAMASTRADQRAAVQAEVEQVLDWAWQAFAHSHGPVDEGGDWDHDLQQQDEGGWHTVTLTLSASQAFLEAFQARFGVPGEED